MPDPNLPWEAPNKARSEVDFDSQRLTSFLRSASQVFTSLKRKNSEREELLLTVEGGGVLRFKVMVVLLEEEQAERESLRRHGSPADTMSFSDGSSRLNTKMPFLDGGADVLQDQPDLLTRIKTNVILHHRSPHQPGSGPEKHPDDRPHSCGFTQRHAARGLHPHLHLEHLGAVQTPESAHL